MASGLSRRAAATRRSRERRGGVPLVDYAIAQWGRQRRGRVRRNTVRTPQPEPVDGTVIEWSWTGPQNTG